jgi:hypothetical protein
MDFVGPRYVKNLGRIYWVTIIDLDTHCAAAYPITGKSSDLILPCLVSFWQKYGIPDFLQMDNELSFRGNNRYRHCYGKVVRLCLMHQIRPIFIPVKEPWRNGVIEKFNDTFNKKFFRTTLFTDYQSLFDKSKEFENFHNNYHRYKANQGKPPLEMFEILKSNKVLLRGDYLLPKTFDVDEGEITIIRFIRSDRKLHLFSEAYLLPNEAIYTYVEAVICYKIHALLVYLDTKLIARFDYWLIP